MDNLQICAPRSAQAAVAEALPILAAWREENRQEIGRRSQVLKATLGQGPWQIGAVGAYFAFVRHPFQGLSSAEVAERLARESGILALPGAFFGEGWMAISASPSPIATAKPLRCWGIDCRVMIRDHIDT